MITQQLAKNSNLQIATGGKSVTMYLYDQFGPADQGKISAKGFSEAVLQAGPVEEMHIHLHSGGGSLFEAMGMYQTLKNHPAKKIMSVMVAASAATYFAMAADEIEMAANGIWMVHYPAGQASGTVEDIASALEGMKRMRQAVVETYSSRTKLPPEDIAKLLQSQTWMTAAEAKSKGFIDRIAPLKQVSANVDLTMFENVPNWCQMALQTLENPEMSNVSPHANVNQALRPELQSIVDDAVGTAVSKIPIIQTPSPEMKARKHFEDEYDRNRTEIENQGIDRPSYVNSCMASYQPDQIETVAASPDRDPGQAAASAITKDLAQREEYRRNRETYSRNGISEDEFVRSQQMHGPINP